MSARNEMYVLVGKIKLTECKKKSVVLLYRRFKRTSYLHFQSHSSVMFMETTGFSEMVVPIGQIKPCRTFVGTVKCWP
jgi:hypothetical protein